MGGIVQFTIYNLYPQEEDETAGLDINDIDSDDLEDDEDDAFMREFRAKRLQGEIEWCFFVQSFRQRTSLSHHSLAKSYGIQRFWWTFLILIELRGANSSIAGTNLAEQTRVFGIVKEVRAEDFVQEVARTFLH